MLLTGIAKQIEAQGRALARRHEAEYLANIFGLDWAESARRGQNEKSKAPSPDLAASRGLDRPLPPPGQGEGLSGKTLRSKKAMPLFEDVLSAVGEATHIAPAEMRGHSRRQRIAYARQLAMYLMRQITRASYPLIGDFFGRGHATVIYACESMRARLPFDAEGRRALDRIATIFSDRHRELQNTRRNEVEPS